MTQSDLEALRAGIALLPELKASEHTWDDFPVNLRGQLQTIIAALEAAASPPVVSVLEMKTSAGPDYFVQVKCGERELELYRFKVKGQAEFTVAEFQWLLNGGEKPDLVDWLDRTAEPAASPPIAGDRRVDEALNHLRVLASTCDDGDVLGCDRIAKLIRDMAASLASPAPVAPRSDTDGR